MSSNSGPPRRNFIRLATPSNKYGFRVLQFNILADTLSGSHPDKGQFSRIDPSYLDWEYRKYRILNEILQYDPDVISLQEVDHYYDFFLPELSAQGYDGLFAPKPTPACRQYSSGSQGDGCALFLRRSRLKIRTSETLTFAFSRSDVGEGQDNQLQAQNQVALIAACELSPADLPSSEREEVREGESRPSEDGVDSVTGREKLGRMRGWGWWRDSGAKNGNTDAAAGLEKGKLEIAGEGGGGGEDLGGRGAYLVIATTHLKASKNGAAELYRQREVQQLLRAIDTVQLSMYKAGWPSAVLLAGDFNALPYACTYAPLAYRTVKEHPLGLRSVLNDDFAEYLHSNCSCHSDDLHGSEAPGRHSRAGSTDDSSAPSQAQTNYEYSKYGTTGRNSPPSVNPNVQGSGCVVGTLASLSMSPEMEPGIYTSWKARKQFGGERVVKHCLDYIFYSPLPTVRIPRPAPLAPPPYIRARPPVAAKEEYAAASLPGIPGLRALSVIELYTPEELGTELLPSSTYPSDHLAIAADLQLEW